MPNSDGADFIEEKKVDPIVSHPENHPSSDQVSTKKIVCNFHVLISLFSANLFRAVFNL